MKRLIQIGLILLIASLGFIYFSTPDFIISTDFKVWRRAGGENQNEISAVMRTIDSGQTGIQLDLTLDKGRFFLTKVEEIDEKDTVLLDEATAELFTSLADKNFNLWISLSELSIDKLLGASELLKEMFHKNRLFGRAFVETESLIFSMILRLRGVPVVYQYDIKKSSLRNIVNKVFVLPVQLLFKIPSISFNVANKSKEGLKDYKGDKLLFTVNDKAIADYYCDESVKVILSELELEEIKELIQDCSVLRE